MSELKIKLNFEVNILCKKLQKDTTLSREEICNWFINEGYSNYFSENDYEDLISNEFFNYAIDGLLIAAVKYNDINRVKELIKKGADVDSEDENGTTPLMWASSKGYVEIVKLLLEKGAEVEYKHAYGGYTALDLATENVEIVKLLLKKTCPHLTIS